MKHAKPYPTAFHQDAIQLVREQGMLPSHVARDLGVDRKTLQRWLDETQPARPPRDGGGLTREVELARLRREHEQLRMERV